MTPSLCHVASEIILITSVSVATSILAATRDDDARAALTLTDVVAGDKE
jgi:hypothetical protein